MSASKNLSTSCSCSTVCGTGSSSRSTRGTASTIGFTVRCRTCACGPATSGRGAGRHPRGVFVEQLEEHRVLPGVDRLLAPWSVVRLGPCTSERRVVQGCGQLHAHGHPLVSQPRAEPALPPPPVRSQRHVQP